MRFTVVISTCSRAESLAATLASLAQVRTTDPWEVLVVDNHSTDDTAAVVERIARDYPVDLRYIYEPTPGKYAAMNRAVAAARGAIVAATDDDAVVAPDWLERAGAALDALQCDIVGGPVTPLWHTPPPRWLDLAKPSIQKVLAILDYGTGVREFGVGIGWPLGVNIAYRREAFARAGPFDPTLGRKAGTLRSQAQREWHLRARAAGCRAFYVPDMRVQHRVEPERMQKQYFRRWHYWQGISRARMYYRYGFDPEEPEAARYDRALPGLFGVPRHLFPKALKALRSYTWRRLRGQEARAFEYELWLCFFAGLARQCARESRSGFANRVIAAGTPGVQISAPEDPGPSISSAPAPTPTSGARLGV